MKMLDLKKITSSESLDLQKMILLEEIRKSSKRLKSKAYGTVMPQNRQLMNSDIGIVKYAAWGISIYKAYQSIRHLIKKIRR